MPTSSSLIHFEPPLLAHRGASAYAPENTLAAFCKAKALGATWVEFDVMLCASGELVVIHDESLERTTNGKGLVAESAYGYLKSLDAGSWFSAAFVGEKIPSLDEVFTLLAELGLKANVELKAQPGREEELVKALLVVLDRFWSKDLPPLLFSSFSVETLRVLRAASGTCQLGLLVHEWFGGWESVLEALSCSTVNVNQELLNAESLATLKSKGLPILTYTVDDPLKAKALQGLGVSAFFTNCPDLLLPVLL